MKTFPILLVFSILFGTSIFGQTKRLALIIGNENYQNNLPLYNPINDANAMEKALQDANFEVFKYIDLDKSSMETAIDDFGKKISNYDVCLVFYAGHGIQYQQLNYLIPVDAKLKSEEDIVSECVEAQRILSIMEASNANTNIVILDACRDNPFERGWSRGSGSKGLAFMNAPSGSIIAYATAPGRTAFDGSGDNGLYTSVLLQYMKIPNLKIEEVFKRTRIMVKEKSKGEQIPWENTSLEGDFYFYKDIEQSTTVISDKKTSVKENKQIFIDQRDGQEYKWVKLGEQIWMAENLNYEMENSWCYGNSTRNCNIYGRLYNWESAMEACPDGWKLPSDQDWKDLEAFLGMSSTEYNERLYRGDNEGDLLKAAGDQHWIETNEKIRDKFGFSVLPGGERSPDGTFYDIGKQGLFFSSTEYSKYSVWCRRFGYNKPDIFRINGAKSLGISVRCIKE